MKKNLLLLALVLQLIPVVLHCQVNRTYYYDKHNLDCLPESAAWFRKFHAIDTAKGIWAGSDYYAGGIKKRSTGQYIREGKAFYPNDTFINYDKEGRIESRGAYVYDHEKKLMGERLGLWKFYYSAGQLKTEFRYEGIVENNRTDEFLVNYWDSTGKQWVTNGDGRYSYTENIGLNKAPGYEVNFVCDYKGGKPDGELTGNYGNGLLYCKEQYSNGKLIKAESYDLAGKKYNYDKVEEDPQFPGGDATLMRFLSHNIIYPQFERDNDVQGKVLLQFVVDTIGNVTNVKVIRSVSKGLDDEAVRVVKLLPNFTPGKRRGQKVPVYFNLPVVYRLQ